MLNLAWSARRGWRSVWPVATEGWAWPVSASTCEPAGFKTAKTLDWRVCACWSISLDDETRRGRFKLASTGPCDHSGRRPTCEAGEVLSTEGGGDLGICDVVFWVTWSRCDIRNCSPSCLWSRRPSH